MTSGFYGDRVRASEARYTCSNDGDQTRMTFSGTGRVDGVMRLIQPLLAWMLRNQLVYSFQDLKTVLEERV